MLKCFRKTLNLVSAGVIRSFIYYRESENGPVIEQLLKGLHLIYYYCCFIIFYYCSGCAVCFSFFLSAAFALAPCLATFIGFITANN